MKSETCTYKAHSIGASENVLDFGLLFQPHMGPSFWYSCALDETPTQRVRTALIICSKTATN